MVHVGEIEVICTFQFKQELKISRHNSYQYLIDEKTKNVIGYVPLRI